MSQARSSVRVVSAEIQREGTYLLTQRQAHAVLPDLWEFPGGRVAVEETDQAALTRALEGRLGCTPVIGSAVMEVTHAYDTYDLTLVVYRCGVSCEPEPRGVQQVRWVPAEELGDYAFPGADQKSIDALLSETGGAAGPK